MSKRARTGLSGLMDAQGLEPKNSGLLVTNSGLMHCWPLLGAVWNYGWSGETAGPLLCRSACERCREVLEREGLGSRCPRPRHPSQPLRRSAPGRGLGFFKPEAPRMKVTGGVAPAQSVSPTIASFNPHLPLSTVRECHPRSQVPASHP